MSRSREPRAADLLRANSRAARHSVAGVVADSLAGIAWLLWLWMLAGAIDAAFSDSHDLGELAPALAAMGALLLLRSLAIFASAGLAERASAILRADLRRELVRTVSTGDPRRLGGATVGRVSGTLTGAVEDLGTWASHYVPSAAMAVVLPAAAFVAVVLLDAPSSLILLFTGPMLVLLLAVIGRRTAEVTRRRFDELGWLRGFYLDMLRGLGTLKAFGRSRDGADLIEQSSRRFGDTTLEVLRTAFQTSLVMEWAATAATALVAVEVSFRLIRDDIGFGTALAVLVVTPEFFAPLRRLSLDYHVGRTGDAAAAQVAEVPGTEHPATEHPGTAHPVAVGGGRRVVSAPRIEFGAVRYRYPGARGYALDGVDLVLEPGETVALAGPSGAGKSTLASLLLRFVEPSAGSVSVDGSDLAGIEAATWRRSVAWVPQSPTLLAGTVADNIALGRPGATDDEIRAAAAGAGAAGFIEELELGYATELGESALRLSGGQRQRIAIARAMLLDAPVVVFDEFTAHLDPGVESSVLEAAADLFEGRTALVIAHRARTRNLADRVVELRAGRVSGVAPGPHGGSQAEPQPGSRR